MDIAYARVATARQDLERQIDVLTAAGISAERIYLDKKSGATTDRPGLRAIPEHARTARCHRGAQLGPARPHGS